MKCPYNGFEECLVEKCPSCIYEEVKERKFECAPGAGLWSRERAISEGVGWYTYITKYVYKGCKLIDNNVQPVPKSEVKITNNTNVKSVAYSQSSLFGF